MDPESPRVSPPSSLRVCHCVTLSASSCLHSEHKLAAGRSQMMTAMTSDNPRTGRGFAQESPFTCGAACVQDQLFVNASLLPEYSLYKQWQHPRNCYIFQGVCLYACLLKAVPAFVFIFTLDSSLVRSACIGQNLEVAVTLVAQDSAFAVVVAKSVCYVCVA